MRKPHSVIHFAEWGFFFIMRYNIENVRRIEGQKVLINEAMQYDMILFA